MLSPSKTIKTLRFLLAATFIMGTSPLAMAAPPSNAKIPEFAKGGKVGEAQDHIIVKFKDNMSPMAKDRLLFIHHLKEKGEIRQLGIKMMGISQEDTPQEVVDRLKAQEPDNIEFAEVDALVAPDLIVNDPNFSSQWHVTKVQAPSAWDTTSGNSVVVAVLDTGTNCAHVDLAPVCVPGWNVVSNSSDTSDIYGHGTATAGTVAEAGNNGLGSAGIAFNAKIMPVRITNDSTGGYANWSDIANGITYAADHGAKVVTNSYQSTDSGSVQSAANYLRSKGGIFLASAGNSGALITTAEVPSVITVAATDSNDARASFSNYGAEIDISAPGVYIYTTNRSGSYSNWSGTSFSAPSAAAVFALIFAANPNLTPSQAESIVKSSAQDLGDPGWDQYYGWGRINAAAAVALAKSSTGTLDTTAPTAPSNLVTTSVDSASVKLSWTGSIDLVGVAGYRVFRDGVQIGTSTSTSYSDSKIVGGATYSYSVKAYDAAGNVSSASNSVTAVVPVAAQVVSILSYSVSQKTANSATITWSTNLQSTGIVSFGTSKTSLSVSATDNSLATSHSVTLSGLKNFTTYYYKISAISSDGSSSASSPVSSFKTSRK